MLRIRYKLISLKRFKLKYYIYLNHYFRISILPYLDLMNVNFTLRLVYAC